MIFRAHTGRGFVSHYHNRSKPAILTYIIQLIPPFLGAFLRRGIRVCTGTCRPSIYAISMWPPPTVEVSNPVRHLRCRLGCQEATDQQACQCQGRATSHLTSYGSGETGPLPRQARQGITSQRSRSPISGNKTELHTRNPTGSDGA